MSATTAAVVAAGASTVSVMAGLPPMSALIAGVCGAGLYQSFTAECSSIRVLLQTFMCGIVAAIIAPYIGDNFLHVKDELKIASITAGLSFLLNLLVPIVIACAPDAIKNWIKRVEK